MNAYTILSYRIVEKEFLEETERDAAADAFGRTAIDLMKEYHERSCGGDVMLVGRLENHKPQPAKDDYALSYGFLETQEPELLEQAKFRQQNYAIFLAFKYPHDNGNELETAQKDLEHLVATTREQIKSLEQEAAADGLSIQLYAGHILSEPAYKEFVMYWPAGATW